VNNPRNNQGDRVSPLKLQTIGLLQAVQYLKVPVLIANILVIVFEAIFGGSL